MYHFNVIKSFLKKSWPSLLLLFVLILLTYGNSLNNAFLSDDLAEIVNNPNVGSLSYAITSHPSSFIRLILYWLVFHMGGLNPVAFRLINIFLHAGSVFVIYILLNLLYSKRLAFFVAGIFAVHPAISEAVVWISGGSYPQYSFFFLLTFLFYLLSTRLNTESRNNKVYYWLSVTTYLLSFMSHEAMPQILFLLFPLWEFLFGNLKKNWIKTVPFLFISVTFLSLTFTKIPQRETTLQSMHYQQGGVDNPLLIMPVSLTTYFELIFFPKDLTLYHSELAFGQIGFIIRALLTLAFLIGIIISFKKNKQVFFWLLFFLFSLAPTLTPFRLNWIVAERYLYLPLLGILVVIGLGFEKLTSSPKFKQTIYAITVLIIILLSIRTVARNIDWANEDNLWIATGKTSPSSPNTHNNLGDVYGRHGDKQAALREFQQAIELKPNYGDAYHNLANTYMELNQPDKALENYQNALKFNPGLWQSYQNIAAIYFGQKKYDLAIENLQKAIQVNPRNLNLRLNLGVVYLMAGQKDKAKEMFTLILSVDPTNQIANQGLSEASK